MIAQTTERQWLENIIERNARLIKETDLEWLNQTHAQANDAIGKLPMPNRKQEAWRYTNLDSLFAQQYFYQDEPITALGVDDIEQWIYPASDSYRLVFANGRCVPALSNIQSLPETIKIGSLRAMLSTDGKLVTKWLEQNAWRSPDVFTELNRALFNDGLFVQVADNVVLDMPIEVVHVNFSVDRNALVQTHSLLVLGAGTSVKLVERFISTGDSTYFSNGTSEVFLGEHARLHHVRLQEESANAHHLSRVAVRQDTASEYSGFNVATGGAWSRTDIQVNFSGPHAVCDLDGIYTVGEKQYTDFHLDIEHAQPHCRSRQDFRGIVYGKGKAVFDGRILVAKDAQKTDAQLTNKNLLLARDAEIDTKPQLEIYADDVKCGHGTTVGKLDPNQLFYLRSRGIPEATAKKMLCLGFAEQLLAKVQDENLHGFIQTQLAEVLADRSSL
jgi:Fe-S cluster assembly protein SufD